MVVVANEWELNQTDEPTEALGLLSKRHVICEKAIDKSKWTEAADWIDSHEGKRDRSGAVSLLPSRNLTDMTCNVTR
jgi:hypothetical protein